MISRYQKIRGRNLVTSTSIVDIPKRIDRNYPSDFFFPDGADGTER
ncbi:hypothetical protein [Henriciella sp.]|nr:hypothetical protein [Henriciella sp.]